MKLPNGYGSIYKQTGKRRKPWRVVLTVGWDLKDQKAIRQRQTLGYYRTRAEAVEALTQYHAAPFDVSSTPTFAEVYKLWTDEHFKEIGKSAAKAIRSCYTRCEKLYKVPFKDIKTRDFEAILQDAAQSGLSAGMVKHISSLFHQMSTYALRKDLCTRDAASAIHLPAMSDSKPIHRALTPDEIDLLWQNTDEPIFQMILLELATGTRPRELLALRSADFHDFYVVGGSKTEAGRNRIIPIHPDVKHFLHPDQEYLIGERMTYQAYKYRAVQACREIGIDDFLPHDLRHTFATLWAAQKLDPIIGRRIMGHAVAGITEQVYVHRSAADLYRELCKLNLHPKTADVIALEK